MKKIRFYYLENEFEPEFLMVDDVKKEAFIFNEDGEKLTKIEKINYPVGNMRNTNKFGVDKIISYFNDYKNVQMFVNIEDRDKFISDFNENLRKEDEYFLNKKSTPKEILKERIWERFENQSTDLGIKYTPIYEKMINYIETMSDEEALNYVSLKISNKKFFLDILSKTGVPRNKVILYHFSLSGGDI